MKNGKKLLSILLAVVMVISALPLVMAKSDVGIGGQCGPNLFWELSDAGKLTIKGTGEMKFDDWDDETDEETGYTKWNRYNDEILTVEIQSGATNIANYAFEDCYNLTSVTIPQTVTVIGYRAFEQCYALTNIAIPSSVKEIGNFAFYYCNSLSSITLPASITVINDGTFYDCYNLKTVNIQGPLTVIGAYAFDYCTSLENFIIPSTVTSIGENAFYNCQKLTSFQIPASVESIGARAFYNYNLQGITVDPNNANYTSENGVLFNKNKTTLIQYPVHIDSTAYTVPATVTRIDFFAFYNAELLESISFNSALKEIGGYAFADSDALTSVSIPNGVESIDPSAFENCSRVETVSIPASTTSISYDAFHFCYSLDSFSVAAENPNYSSDSYGVFFNKAQTDLIQYPAGNERISYTVPATVEAIKSNAFYYAQALSSVTLPSGLTAIDYRAFYDCDSLLSIDIPASVKEIGSYAFSNCNALEAVTLHNGLETIGYEAFVGCSSLPTVTIPASVTYIGERVFSGCSSMTSIQVAAANKNYSNDANGILYNSDKTNVKQYPLGNPAETVNLPLSVDTIGSFAFYGARYLTSITLPKNLQALSNYAFASCSKLQYVKIPDGLKEIGPDAFSGCYSLQTLYIPFSVKTIRSWAFNFYPESKLTVHYAGSEAEWNRISIEHSNDALESENTVFDFCKHTTINNVPAVAPTCSVAGYTAGTQCALCERYLSGHQKIFAAHIDANSDDKCDICGGAPSQLSLDSATVISCNYGEESKRFIPLEDGFYEFRLVNSNKDSGFYASIGATVYDVYDDDYYYNQMSSCYGEDTATLKAYFEAGKTYALKTYLEWGEQTELSVTVEKVPGGYCGDYVMWEIEEVPAESGTQKVLRLEGVGPMWFYQFDVSPWVGMSDVTVLDVGAEVDYLDAIALAPLTGIKTIYARNSYLLVSEFFAANQNDLLVYCYLSSRDYYYCEDNGIAYELLGDGPETLIRDKDTDVAIAFDNDSFETPIAALQVTPQETGDANKLSWDIKPLDESGNVVQPVEPVQIRLPLPTGWTERDKENLLIHHTYEIDGEPVEETIADFEIINDYVVFWVEHFSVFSIEYVNNTPGTHTHNYSLHVLVENTCESEGYGMMVCSICGSSYPMTLPKHFFGDWVVRKVCTCSESGVRTRVCARCGYEESVTDEPLEHNYVFAGTVPATCGTNGYDKYVCRSYNSDSRVGCGKIRMENIKPATGNHKDKDNNGKCDVCGKVLTNTDTVVVTGCKYCGKVHTGIFAWLIQFIHNILFRIAGPKKG